MAGAALNRGVDARVRAASSIHEEIITLRADANRQQPAAGARLAACVMGSPWLARAVLKQCFGHPAEREPAAKISSPAAVGRSANRPGVVFGYAVGDRCQAGGFVPVLAHTARICHHEPRRKCDSLATDALIGRRGA
jgi:hypothetical protein